MKKHSFESRRRTDVQSRTYTRPHQLKRLCRFWHRLADIWSSRPDRPTNFTKAAVRVAQTSQCPVLFALRTERIENSSSPLADKQTVVTVGLIDRNGSNRAVRIAFQHWDCLPGADEPGIFHTRSRARSYWASRVGAESLA